MVAVRRVLLSELVIRGLTQPANCHCEKRSDEAICPVTEKEFFVYILTNKNHTVLYTGVTSNLIRRVHQHRTHSIKGFTSRYNVDKLAFFERAADASAAIAREKQIKGASRDRKIALINSQNPDWRDLYSDLL